MNGAVNALYSVIMPTYNRAYTIKKAINSVLAQTYENWELIIVDDGSTDDTEATVASIGDARIRYHYKKNNAGPSAARNYGIEQAKGQWIIYLDSDDHYEPECIATIQAWLAKNPNAVFALPGVAVTLELYKEGRLVKSVSESTDIPHDLTVRDIFMRHPHLWYGGLTHTRTVFTEGMRWDDNLWHMEEWDFTMGIAEKYPDGFLLVPVTLYNYRQRYGSDNIISKATYKTWADAFEYIYQKHAKDTLLEGQTWYPSRVERWNRYQNEFEAGTRPPYRDHYF
jgi:glycosyltransferase involved in cell wall biosynthesis